MYNIKPLPKFFAGSSHIEEDVSGGGGDTVEDAILDYLQNHAEDELESWYDYDKCEWVEFTVKVFDVLSKQEAQPFIEEDSWEDHWTFMLGGEAHSRVFEAKHCDDADEFIIRVKNQGGSNGCL